MVLGTKIPSGFPSRTFRVAQAAAETRKREGRRLNAPPLLPPLLPLPPETQLSFISTPSKPHWKNNRRFKICPANFQCYIDFFHHLVCAPPINQETRLRSFLRYETPRCCEPLLFRLEDLFLITSSNVAQTLFPLGATSVQIKLQKSFLPLQSGRN